MIRARRATWGAVRERWASDSSRCRSSAVRINATLGRPVACSPPCRAVRAGRAICFTFYSDRTLDRANHATKEVGQLLLADVGVPAGTVEACAPVVDVLATPKPKERRCAGHANSGQVSVTSFCRW